MSNSPTNRHGSSISLQRVTPDDEEFLLVVYGESRAQELAQVTWEPGQKEQFVRWQFEMQRQEYDARFPDARYDIILVDGVRVGRIWVGSDEKEIRLLDIAILQEFQNRGVGTVLLRQLIEEATQTNKSLRHMVFMLNDNGYRFYERLGFVTVEDVGGYKHMEWVPKSEPSHNA